MADITTLLKQLGLNAGLASQIEPQGLSPEAAQYYAQEYARSGKLPAMGRDSQAQLQRKQILENARLYQQKKHLEYMGLPTELAGASPAMIDRMIQEGSVPPAYMGIDEDMGSLNEPARPMPNVTSPNAVFDPKTGEYLGEYEFIPQNGLLYR